jgi:copper/silver efflux system protein
MRNLADLQAAILQGAVRRLRPKLMTAATMFLGLVPVMWAMGTGSDVMKRIAAPMIGGIFTSFVLELLVYPAVYQIWKRPRRDGARTALPVDAGSREVG